jgi:primase-polymerase (primpol)-like protein
MPITFGSVGDLISISLIVKDLLVAIDESRGSSAEYKAVVNELWILDRALLEVELLSRKYTGTPEFNALYTTASKTVERCRSSIEAFTARIKKYDDHFTGNGRKSGIRGLGMKIRWQITEKDEVEKFRAEVTAHSAAINMLLATATV